VNELYQQLIIDHGRHPRNHCACDQATHTHEGYNPLCGDKVKIYVEVEEDCIRQLTFEGTGCAISMASASMMTDALKDKSVDEAKKVFYAFRDVVTGEQQASENLGKLGVLAGVSAYPMRVKCATLAWHTFMSAIENSNETVTTE